MAIRDMLRHFDSSDQYFASHVMDLFDQVDDGHGVRWTSFCDLHQAEIVMRISNAYHVYVQKFGGWDEAERVLYLIGPHENFSYTIPISAIRLDSYNALSHRDILGAVLGLGIKRDQVGDIVQTQDGFVIFVKHPANQLILNDLEKVGRESVVAREIELSCVGEPIRNFKTITGTVKSLRLDSVVSLCCGCSREKGKQLIEKERVTVNAAMKNSPAVLIPESCIISIRGYGKFQVDFNGTISAKGRYFITANKYL